MARISKPMVPAGPLGTLVNELYELYLTAGEPSVRDITARTEPKISRDTVHRILKNDTLPRYQALLAVVRALGGNEERFAELWRAARLTEESPRIDVGPPSGSGNQVDEIQQPSPPIRVMIVDDHGLFRRGLEMVLGEVDDVQLVASASNGLEAIETASLLRPDVILMDIRMPGMNGIDATSRIHSMDPSIKVLILTISDNEEDLVSALRAGAWGYLLKDVPLDELPRSIRAVAAGQTIISPQISEIAVREYALGKSRLAEEERGYAILTAKEREIVRLVGRAKSDAEISDLLGIARSTVAVHIRNILLKTQLSSRAQLVRFAIKRGLD